MSILLAALAKGALTAVIGPFVEEAREAALNAAQETIRSTVAGAMSIGEWANIVIESVDKVKENAIEENDLRFIGGKLKFANNEKNLDKIKVSFQLYFLDEAEKWQMAEADSDIPSSKFTVDALNELKDKGQIVFEVE